MSFIAFLPLPPSANNQYESKTKGGRRLSEAAYSWREQTIVTIRQAWALAGLALTGEPLAFELVLLAPPDGRRHDLDNSIKPTLDCFAAALGFDDDCVQEIRAKKVVGAAAVGIWVSLASADVSPADALVELWSPGYPGAAAS